MQKLLAAMTLAVLAGTIAPAVANDPYDAPRATFGAARDLLLAHLDAAKTNSDDAYDIVSRLSAAISALGDEPAGDSGRVADESEHASLDLAWVQAVTSGTCPKIATAGTSESCCRSTIDGTLQPVAVYVPATHAASSPAVVVLRGRGQSESDLASYHDLHALADRSQAILILPYARGRATLDRSATQDVFDAMDMVAKSFPIDEKRTYVAGFSMGGIAAFHIAGSAPGRFEALLSVVGTLSPADREAMRAFARPIYVVNAERDTLVTPDLGRESVAYLRANGHTARYYEQKDGVHSFGSVLPAMREAWTDMFAGVTNQPPLGNATAAPFALPAAEPTRIPSQGRPS